MRIALIGYGKMGKAIEKIALTRQHQITLKSRQTPDWKSLKGTQIAIEFSHPKAAFANIKSCIENTIPVVCGTTGWLEKRDVIYQLCKEKKGAFLYSSNFSIGVNIFFEINRKLANLMVSYKDYKAEIKEIHHIEKKDIPSGTAITLAEIIIKQGVAKKWVIGSKKEEDQQLSIISERLDQIPGIHTVSYRSTIDEINLQHKANNREGFALGAVIAAEWLNGKKGIFSMKDVLSIGV